MLEIWTRLAAALPAVDAGERARSAVLVPLYQDAEGIVRIVLTRRPDTMRTHPGDVVFPGGRIEPGETTVEAALREAWEEVAIPRESVEVLGGLQPVTTRDQDNWIAPIVARIVRPAQLVPDPAEVAAIIEPPISELLDETRWRTADWFGTPLWFYDFPEGTLWGATAFMVRQLLALLRR